MKYYFSSKAESLSSGNPNINSDKFKTNWNVLLNYVSPEIEPPDKTNNSPSSPIISQQNLNNQDEQENRTIDLVGLANTTMPSGMLIYTRSTSAVTTTKEWLSWSSSSSCESFETTGTDLNPPSSIESDSNGEHIKVSAIYHFLTNHTRFIINPGII